MTTKIKAHPITFTAPMARAILDGSEFMTRTIVKPQLGPCADWMTFQSGRWVATGLVGDIPDSIRLRFERNGRSAT